MRSDLRSKIEEHIAQHPGASTRSLSRALGVSESTADYHLRRLRREGRASPENVGRETCWFAARAGFCPVLRRAIPAMRRAEVQRVALALTSLPASAPGAAIAAGIEVGKLRWAVAVLRDAGLADRTRWGKVHLVEGAEFCVGKASCAERCGRWGECPVSRAFMAKLAASAELMPPSRGGGE